MSSKEMAQALAEEVGRLQKEAAAKVKPLAPGEVQCHATSKDGLGSWCCQLEDGHAGPHEWPDPILGIV